MHLQRPVTRYMMSDKQDTAFSLACEIGTEIRIAGNSDVEFDTKQLTEKT